jgi:uncharacterized membrane protein
MCVRMNTHTHVRLLRVYYRAHNLKPIRVFSSSVTGFIGFVLQRLQFTRSDNSENHLLAFVVLILQHILYIHIALRASGSKLCA